MGFLGLLAPERRQAGALVAYGQVGPRKTAWFRLFEDQRHLHPKARKVKRAMRQRAMRQHLTVRANALEENVVLSKVERDKRTDLEPKGSAPSPNGKALRDEGRAVGSAAAEVKLRRIVSVPKAEIDRRAKAWANRRRQSQQRT